MTRVIASRAIAIVVSIGLLAWLVADARWQGVGLRLRRIDVMSLIAVALLFAASYAMRGARIHGEFRDEIPDAAHGMRTYLRILRLTLVHNALVNVLPFRSGEAAFPVLLSRWFGIGTGRAVVSLLWLRAQDATVVLVLAALLWPGLAFGWRITALVVLAGSAVLVPMWARARPADPPTTAGALSKVRALLDRSTRRNTAGWLWTIGNWSVKLIAEAWLVALALGLQQTAHATAALGAIGAELAAILPIQGVAGFGTFEAGGAVLMRTVGIEMGHGLEAILVLHAVVLGLALVAGAMAAAFLPGPMKTE